MFKPSLTALQLCFCVTQAPFIWSKVPEITLSLARQLCETFIWNLTPVNLHSARLNIRKLRTIGKNCCKHPDNNMRTHFLFQLSRLESARQSVNMRKSCPTCPGYPTCRNETTRPPQFVSPTRDKFTTACKRSAKFFKEVSEKLACPGYLGEKVDSGTHLHS